MKSGLLKAEGAGNDFLVGVGRWAERLAVDEALVRRLCDRRRGVGADGTVALVAGEGGRVEIVYRNSDGGIARFCANATRCAARAAVWFLGQPSSLTIATGWADIPALVDDHGVRLELPEPDGEPSPITLSPAAVGSWHVVVGVPHLVVPADRLDALDLRAVAPPLRFHPSLRPGGANVNYFETEADGTVRVRSWERGVEGETLCCGSGLVAVALVVMANDDIRRVELVPASGDRLTVEALDEPPCCPTLFLGPARLVARIEPFEPP